MITKTAPVRWHAASMAVLALLIAGAPLPGAARELQGDGQGKAQGPAQVEELIEQAVAMFEATTPDGTGAQKIIDAWQAVIAAAEIHAPGHPEIPRARIRIASQLYILGRNDEARASVQQGLTALEAGNADSIVVRGEGVALLGTLLAQAGEADAAIAALEAGYVQYLASFATLAPGEVDRGAVVSKSNLEFSLSQTLLQLSRIDEALHYQRLSLATREGFLGPHDPDTIGSYFGYAGTLRRAGQMDEAERYARIAVERAVAHLAPSHPNYSRALEMLAIILSRTGRSIEATDYLARSLELKREHEGPDSLFFGYGLHLLATIYHQRERYAEAVPLFEEAAPIFARYQGAGSPFGLGSAGYAAQGRFALGDSGALSRLKAVDERMAASTVDADIAKRIGPDLVRALIRAGDPAAAAQIAARDYARLAETENAAAFALRHARLVDARARSVLANRPQEAVGEARAMLGSLGRDQARGTSGLLFAEARAALDLVMEIAADSDDADLMAAAMALATGSGLAQASALRAERLATQDPAAAAALRALQQADAALDAADRETLRALARGTPSEAARARLVAAEAARETALAALRASDGVTASLLTPPAASLKAIRAALAQGEALLAIAPAYDGAYSLVVTADQALVRRLDLPRAALVELAAAVRDSAANLDFDEAAAARLGAVLLPADTRTALERAASLRILAGGAFASLPFGLLVLEPASRSTGAQFLADRFALANAASLTPVAKNVVKRGSGLVAFAAPTPFASVTAPQGSSQPVASPSRYFARGGIAADQLAQLPALPGTLKEAQALAREFGNGRAHLFTGAGASEANLADPSVATADVLLFATHGLVAGELEGLAEPALVLAAPPASHDSAHDGVLTASEIARLDLAADWVILSACDSAAGFAGGAPAFSGLVSAFRLAGGGSVLATHWQVRDDVAAFVTTAMLRHYRQHGDKAEALAHALHQLRHESGLEGAARPEIWAPFVLIE